MLVGKNSIAGDAEVQLVDLLFVTRKKPPSLAKFVSTSLRFAARFKEAERDDAVQVLEHFGWAPQRFSSRAKPYGRLALRLKQIFTVLAEEAEGEDSERRMWAMNLITELTGANSLRLVLAGLLADFSAEHLAWVRLLDTEELDPVQRSDACRAFRARLRVLFEDGLIYTTALECTFTGQVLKFLANPNVLYVRRVAQVVSIGALDGREELFEPLHRMRQIVKNVDALLERYMRETSWAQHFASFTLPSPLLGETVSSSPLQERAREKARIAVFAICKARELPFADTLQELQNLIPSATAYRERGYSLKNSWARASADFPELARARDVVSLLLGCTLSTSRTERTLAVVAVHEKRHVDAATMEAILLANEAPDEDEIVKYVRINRDHMKQEYVGDYVEEILVRYRKAYPKRKFRLQVKARRDKGIKKNALLLKEQRIARGAPQPAVEFQRERARAITEATTLSEDRKRTILQESCAVGGLVPSAESERATSFESAAMTTLRSEARACAAKKDASEVPSEPRDRVRASARKQRTRWGHDCDDAQDVRKKPGVAWVASGDPAVMAILHKAGFKTIPRSQGLPYMIKKAAKQFAENAYKCNVFVIKDLRRECKSPAAIACMLLGGFLVSDNTILNSSKLLQGPNAFARLCPPMGILFEHTLSKQNRTLWVSTGVHALWDELVDVWTTLESVSKGKLCIVATEKDFNTHWDEYVAARGAKSQPWTQMRKVRTKQELDDVTLVAELRRVISLDELQGFVAKAIGSTALPGSWS